MRARRIEKREITDRVTRGSLDHIKGGPLPLVQRDGRVRTSPYPPHIWAGIWGCRSYRTFEPTLGPLIGWKKGRATTGQVARIFRTSLEGPIIDALKLIENTDTLAP